MEENSENKLHALDYWQVIRNRYGVILLAFLLIFSTAAVITYIIPKEYPGRVQLELNGEDQRVKVGRDRVDLHPLLANNFLETEFEVIQSKETLYRVIDELGLMDRWGARTRPEAYQMLLSDLQAEATRGTNIVTIEVLSESWDEAAEIANQVAKSYMERRQELDDKQIAAGLETLMTQIQAQRTLVGNAEASKMALQRKYGVIELSGSSSDGGISGTRTVANMDLPRIKEQILEKRRELETIRTTIQILSQKTGDELISQAVELGVDNETIRTMEPRYKDFRLKEQELLGSGLGRKHPKVVAVRNQIVEARTMLENAVVAYRNSLPTKQQIAEESFKNLESMATEAKTASLEEREHYAEFLNAKGEWERQKLLLADLEKEYALESANRKMSRTPAVVHEWAEADSNPVKPNVTLNFALGGIVGLAFGIGLAFFLEYMDTSVKSLDDVERYLQVPVLAVIPKDVGMLHKENGMSPDAEAYRILRTNIEFNRGSAGANAITVVSGGAGEGKSTTLVNLAYVCAQGGYTTLIIDGDLRRPRVHTFFDIPNHVGLSNYLTSDTPLEEVVLKTPIDNLYFMPSGILPADAAGILNSQRMSELIADVKSRFDLVLIDSPPILGVSDASVLVAECDLTMIVVQHRKLPRNMLMRVKQGVQNVGGNLLGVVLNNVDVRSDSQYQYYTSYYTYYTPNNTAPKKPKKQKAKVTKELAAAPSPKGDGGGKSFGDDFFSEEY